MHRKKIKSLTKIHLSGEMQKSLKKLKDSIEYEHYAKKALINKLEHYYDLIEKNILKLEKKKKDVFILRVKLESFPHKLKFFELYGNEEEFYKVYNLLNSVHEELKKKDV
jgi:hypothetical protein